MFQFVAQGEVLGGGTELPAGSRQGGNPAAIGTAVADFALVALRQGEAEGFSDGAVSLG